MHVIVDEARNDRSALKVDHPCVGSDLILHVIVAAHLDNPFAPNRQGFGDGKLTVDRQDSAVAKYLVGKCRLFGLTCGQNNRRHDREHPRSIRKQTPHIHILPYIVFISFCILYKQS